MKIEDLPLFKNKYDCVFSLGSACFCAEMLAKAKLRVFSSPFDWIGCSNFKNRMDFICNDFEGFINKEYLKKTGETEYPEECDVYKDEKTGFIFKHDFPKGMELSKGYEIVKEKFDRKNNRLIKKLKESKHSLIVYMCYHEMEEPVEDLIEMSKKINEHFNKQTIDVVLVVHNSELKIDEMKIDKVSENAYRIGVYNLQENGGIGNYDACKNFLSKIKLKKNLKDMLFKVSKGRKRMRVYLFGIKILSFQYHN